MTVLLVGADRMEFQGLERDFGPPVRLKWPIDHSVAYDRAGMRLVAVANGAGPSLAAEATNTALDREPVQAIVSVGFIWVVTARAEHIPRTWIVIGLSSFSGSFINFFLRFDKIASAGFFSTVFSMVCVLISL